MSMNKLIIGLKNILFTDYTCTQLLLSDEETVDFNLNIAVTIAVCNSIIKSSSLNESADIHRKNLKGYRKSNRNEYNNRFKDDIETKNYFLIENARSLKKNIDYIVKNQHRDLDVFNVMNNTDCDVDYDTIEYYRQSINEHKLVDYKDPVIYNQVMNWANIGIKNVYKSIPKSSGVIVQTHNNHNNVGIPQLCKLCKVNYEKEKSDTKEFVAYKAGDNICLINKKVKYIFDRVSYDKLVDFCGERYDELSCKIADGI